MSAPSTGGPGATERMALCVLLLAFVAGPTPGDIGGCGQEAQPLDAGVFFSTKLNIDCRRCSECGLLTSVCRSACDVTTPFPQSFPAGCTPLVHDGEVCLRALLNASCADYASFVSDSAAEQTVPSECNFCPRR